MRGRRASWLLLLLLLLLTALLPAGTALAAGDFLPESPRPTAWGSEPIYDRYPLWHYTYGARLQGADTIYRLFYLMNLVQVGKAWFLKVALRSVEYAIFYDAVTPLVERAGKGLQTLVSVLWDGDSGVLVVTGLAVAGALAAWHGLFRSRRISALRILAGAAAILVGSYALFTVAPQTLTNSASIARGLSTQIFNGIGAVVAPAGTAVPPARLLRAAGESAWMAYVHEPWLDGEFTQNAGNKPAYRDGNIEGGLWLAESPTRRQQRYPYLDPATKLQDFHQWNDDYVLDYLPRRVLLSLTSAGVTALYAGSMLLLAGAILFYQLLLLVILALSPLWLLVALFHPGGLRLVRGAVVRAVGALLLQVVLSAVLAVLLLLTPTVASLAAPLGWMAQGLLLALLALALYRYRFRWLRWGREQGAEERQPRPVSVWERLARRRSPEVLTPVREVVRTASLPAVPPLPRFREEVARTLPEAAGGSAPVVVAVAELAEEMRRLRLRLGRQEDGGPVERLERLSEVRPERSREAGGGAPPAGSTGAGAGPASASASGGGLGAVKRPRPDQAKTLHLYRNR